LSGVDGFGIKKPTVDAIARLAHFDAPYSFPGQTYAGDKYYTKTSDFLAGALDPVPTALCPEVTVPGPNGTQVRVHRCSSFNQTIRGRHNDALFTMTTLNFMQTIKPLAEVFENHNANADLAGLFVTLHQHWGSADQPKDLCDPSLPRTDPRWCSQDGIAKVEPVLAEALQGDFFPALSAVVSTLGGMSINHCDAFNADGSCSKATARKGNQVIAEFIRSVVDPKRTPGLTDRSGRTFVTRPDGIKVEKLAPAHLLIGGFRRMGTAFDDYVKNTPEDKNLKARWSQATTLILDAFLTVDGAAEKSAFKNPAVPKIVPVLFDTFQSQVRSNCPANGPKPCPWAAKELPNAVASFVEGPLFPALGDVMNIARRDPLARREFIRFAEYLLEQDANQQTASSLAEILELLGDEQNTRPFVNLVSRVLAEADADGKLRSNVLKPAVNFTARLFDLGTNAQGVQDCRNQIDPNRTLPLVLQKLVTPVGSNKRAPVQVFASVMGDVSRANAKDTGPITANDAKAILTDSRELLLDERSGVKRITAVIRKVFAGQ
jgi:hypothetical protein